MNIEKNKKVAIVVGGSGGIGSDIAKQLALQSEMMVVICYFNNRSSAEQTVSFITNNGGYACVYYLDVCDSNEVEGLFKYVVKKYGRIDVVVNNAGVITTSNIVDTTESQYNQIFSVNVYGALQVLRQAAKCLNENGRIINTSSTMVGSPIAGGALYCASKAALESFSKALSRELGERAITVNSIRVGPTIPGMFAKAPEQRQKQLAMASPFKRLGKPDDIANVVSFLVSDKSQWITGQNIVIDGGVF